MKPGERDSLATASGALVIECWLLAYAHDVCPSRARKGGQGKISLRLFHGELAGRMDLEQAGRSAGDLYERLRYDRCGQMFRRAPRAAIPLMMSLRMKLGLLAICSLAAELLTTVPASIVAGAAPIVPVMLASCPSA